MVNLSRDWARAVVDVPVPTSVDVNRVNEILREVGRDAFRDPAMRPLLLDPPTVMGVETLGLDEVNVRVVARTLPGKQFEVGRDLRARIVAAFGRQGMAVQPPATPEPRTGRSGPGGGPMSGADDEVPGEQPALEQPAVRTAPPAARTQRWWTAIPSHLGRARTSTVVLGVLFVAIFALYLNVRPDPVPTAPGDETSVTKPARTTSGATTPSTTTPATTTPTGTRSTTSGPTTSGGAGETTSELPTTGSTTEEPLPTTGSPSG